MPAAADVIADEGYDAESDKNCAPRSFNGITHSKIKYKKRNLIERCCSNSGTSRPATIAAYRTTSLGSNLLPCAYGSGFMVPLVQGLSGSFVDCRHQISSSRLLDHVASAYNAVQLALLDFAVQSGGLLVNIDYAVFFARNYDGRHGKFVVDAAGIISAVSAALARICDGRTAISLGKPANFAGTERGPNILCNMAGHINLLMIGEMVKLTMSPSPGMAGADSAKTSVRTVGK